MFFLFAFPLGPNNKYAAADNAATLASATTVLPPENDFFAIYISWLSGNTVSIRFFLAGTIFYGAFLQTID